MARRSEFYTDAKAEWEKQNTYLFSVRLQNSTDADIIERIQAAPSRQGEIKRLVRLGIAYEKLQREGTAPTPVAETERPKLKNDYGFERTASGLPDLRKVKRWNQEENNEEEKEK